MPITFNEILRSAGIDPATVRLVRHHDNRADRDLQPYNLWQLRETSDAFMKYQSRQGERSTKLLSASPIWAVFVSTPRNETLFVGLFDASNPQPGPIGVPQMAIRGAVEDTPYNVFDLSLRTELDEFIGVLVVAWGDGKLAWIQRADKKEKRILELRREFKEERFPGYLRFIKSLSEIGSLPPAWTERLREARGVYVLSCPKTKELYVGSATGQGGFHERWLQHATKGGDAVRFRSREPSDYRVAILEVAGSSMSRDDVIAIEQEWMRKLQTVDMGLNGGIIPSEASQPAQPTRSA